MWPWRVHEPVLAREAVDGIITLLMRIDENVARLLADEDENGEEEVEG